MQTSSKLQLIVLSLLFWFSAQAQIEIVDPDKILDNLPNKTYAAKFSDSYTCGTKYDFSIHVGRCTLSCNLGVCGTQCELDDTRPALMQIDECKSDSYAVYSSLGHTWTITETDYTAASNTVILGFLKGFDLFYEPVAKIKINHLIYPVPRKFIANGKMNNITTGVLEFSVYPEKKSEEFTAFYIEVDFYKTGLDQLMYMSSEFFVNSNQKDLVLKRKGLINGL